MTGKLLAIIVAILIIAPILLPVMGALTQSITTVITSYAQSEDVNGSASITGQVTVAATQPTVSFTLYSDNYTTTTTSITPQTTVYMTITVSGDNPLEEYTIKAQMFADNNSNGVGTPPTQTSPEKYVNFTIYYDSQQNQWTLESDTGGSSTWSIVLNDKVYQPDPTKDSGTFYLNITFGKTAREARSTGELAPAKDWDIIVTATVGSGDLAASNQASGYGYTVYFYSEVSSSASSISFGTITADSSSDIQQVDSSSANTFTVTVIANGYYDLKATTDQSWTATDGSGHSITLSTSTTLGEKEFSLQISNTTSTSNPGYPENPVYVTSDVNTANPFVNNAQPTTESGVSTNIYMQINLGSNIYTGTYQGTIVIHAVDGG